LITASTADASSTILLTPGRLAAFGEQFVHQGCATFQVAAGTLTGALDAALLSSNAQFVVLQAEDDFVTDIDTQGPCGRKRESQSCRSG